MNVVSVMRLFRKNSFVTFAVLVLFVVIQIPYLSQGIEMQGKKYERISMILFIQYFQHCIFHHCI